MASNNSNTLKLCSSWILPKLRFDVIWGLKTDEQVIEGEEKDVEQDRFSAARHPENPSESGGTGGTTKPLHGMFKAVHCSYLFL